jgi:hypothetical protein
MQLPKAFKQLSRAVLITLGLLVVSLVRPSKRASNMVLLPVNNMAKLVELPRRITKPLHRVPSKPLLVRNLISKRQQWQRLQGLKASIQEDCKLAVI